MEDMGTICIHRCNGICHSLFVYTKWRLGIADGKYENDGTTAFDHPTYQKLISDHITDVLHLPEAILLMFQQGGFVVNIMGRPWHSVGIDEAHEMLINKQCKMSIVKPSEDYINRVAKFLTYRTNALESTTNQLFPEMNKKSTEY